LKKFFSISFAILFLFFAAGYYLIFISMDKKVKLEMAHLIQSSPTHSSTVQFSFSKKELLHDVHFTSSSQNEFIYHGEHYDVVKTQNDGDQTLFFCIADKKETSLFAQFKKQTSDSSPSNSSGKIQLKQADWMFQSLNKEIYFSHSVCLLTNFTAIITSSQEEIFSPPPMG